jgi:nitrate reductase molybdenum cofactor assembly chaperone
MDTANHADIGAAHSALARLLRYPHGGWRDARRAILLAEIRIPHVAEVARRLDNLREQLEPLGDHGIEELFARTFDINPAVSMDVGFQLHGLAYKRGEFLVRAGAAVSRLGVDTRGELADHLPVMLELAAAMEADERRELIEHCIAPAVRRMASGLPLESAGFGEAIHAVDAFLRANFGCADVGPPPPDEGYEALEEPKASMMF